MKWSGQWTYNHYSWWTCFHIISCNGLLLTTEYVTLWLAERPSLLSTKLKISKTFNVVECPKFYSLFLYIGEEKIVNKDIFHHTKVTNMIYKEYWKEYQILKDGLTVRLISKSFYIHLYWFITDSGHLATFSLQQIYEVIQISTATYMAITTHYMTKDGNNLLTFKSQLIAFPHMERSHSDANIVDAFLKVINELGIAYKVCLFLIYSNNFYWVIMACHQLGQMTTDNASNNNTFLKCMAYKLNRWVIAFSAVGNHVRWASSAYYQCIDVNNSMILIVC